MKNLTFCTRSSNFSSVALKIWFELTIRRERREGCRKGGPKKMTWTWEVVLMHSRPLLCTQAGMHRHGLQTVTLLLRSKSQWDVWSWCRDLRKVRESARKERRAGKICKTSWYGPWYPSRRLGHCGDTARMSVFASQLLIQSGWMIWNQPDSWKVPSMYDGQEQAK